MDYQNENPVDLDEVQRMIGTSLDLYQSLVDIFIEESVDQISLISESIINKNHVSLDNSSHSFKSSLATLGAFRASKLAEQLEIMGKSGSTNGSLELFSKLELEYELVLSYFCVNHCCSFCKCYNPQDFFI